MFVDDIVAVFPSQTAVAQAFSVGLAAYANQQQVEFNFGPAKTAALPMFGAPADKIQGITCNDYKLLGVQFDENLDFSKPADHILRVGKVLFYEIFESAAHAHLPAPIIAEAVVQRIEPIVLFAAEIWPLVPSFL